MNELFTNFYELFHYKIPFSDDLYAEGLYFSIGLYTLLSSLFLVVTFYYLINRPHFARWYHWLIIMLINSVICFGIAVVIPQHKFVELGIEYGSDYYQFALKNACISILLFTILSYLGKWWSTNAKGTPRLFLGKF